MANEGTPFLRMEGICKSFGGVQALKSVDFEARSGEVHALMGENGAGKSTLIKILAGAYSKDEGRIFLDGQEVDIKNPKDALLHGVSVIYQEMALIGHLTVAENIMIDEISASARVDWGHIQRRSAEILEQLGFSEIDVRKPANSLPVAYQQVVEIAKALSRNAKILVFDEPTAVLTNKEVDKLFEIIARLREAGTCILYVSHRLEEIFRICDRISILKDGAYVGTVEVSSITKDELVTMMVGRELTDMYPERNAQIGDVMLEVKNLSSGDMVRDVSFSVRAGEVLGFSGLVGAGRTETMQAIFGARRVDSGEVFVDGQKVVNKLPQDGIKHGIGMVPEDRKQDGVILSLPIYYNGTISILDRLSDKLGRVDTKREQEIVGGLINDLALKCASMFHPVSSLSGGNQQKVSLMKWLAAGGRVLILDEPTRGVDVGAKTEIYRIINKLAEQGLAIVMVSSEMPELIGECDRVLVMRQGKVTGELVGDQITEQNMIRLAMEVA